jgi:hypothetical protein
VVYHMLRHGMEHLTIALCNTNKRASSPPLRVICLQSSPQISHLSTSSFIPPTSLPTILSHNYCKASISTAPNHSQLTASILKANHCHDQDSCTNFPVGFCSRGSCTYVTLSHTWLKKKGCYNLTAPISSADFPVTQSMEVHFNEVENIFHEVKSLSLHS